MKYQLEYDKLALTEPFYYEERGEWLDCLQIWLRFSPIFTVPKGDTPIEVPLNLKDGTKKMLSDLVRVAFDGKKFTFENVQDTLVQYEIVAYGRGLTNDNNIHITDAKEFTEIVKKYNQYIEIDTRLQNLAYSWHLLD
ncbi:MULTISPECIES: hypothetical protein [Lactobacillaceae]|uniref:hypothetical protein n=1 Tax=Lactobacillaceae TaxID=33958 RepID=UPI00031F2FF8|nr:MULTISPECIES: hypothetical protein [Lactobacillaceae]MBC6925360.1 hypothetical protein [Ligilactobacillus salivarius]MBL1070057.1 hypothetical protein [Ligilactobacillus salivarius]MCP8863939.1 hypothetical protein [Latilactobacillus curvatus]MCP8867417.1 hypothetical protein [Latilactobacillus curvatus]MCP8870957.1 hypothetical protein [Latilactobacillus curvatus]